MRNRRELQTGLVGVFLVDLSLNRGRCAVYIDAVADSHALLMVMQCVVPVVLRDVPLNNAFFSLSCSHTPRRLK